MLVAECARAHHAATSDCVQFVEVLLTGRDAVYARMFTRSSLVRLCTTGLISWAHSPLRVPCFMSHICRASMLGERPARGGTGPRPRRSGPWQTPQATVFPLP